MQCNLYHKAYYDREAKTAPLKTEDYCFILNPKANTHATTIPFGEIRWLVRIKSKRSYRTITIIPTDLAPTNATFLYYPIREILHARSSREASFVRESDWQKEDLVRFDAELENCDQQEDTVEFEPFSQPEKKANFQISRGAPAEQPTVNEEPQTTEKNRQ